MFVAGRSSPWWLSGVSAYMTMFTAGTFVVWGGLTTNSTGWRGHLLDVRNRRISRRPLFCRQMAGNQSVYPR